MEFLSHTGAQMGCPKEIKSEGDSIERLLGVAVWR